MDKQGLIQFIQDNDQAFYDLSDKIWDHAEVRFTEKESVADYDAFLQARGFRTKVGIAGMDTALRAEWGQGSPVIGFLGEYDALPNLSQLAGIPTQKPLQEGGAGHGCGHNLLGVGSLIAAVGMKEYLQQEGKPGTVVFFGCPAEEGGSGKAFMAREGCFDALDCAYSWHPAPVTTMVPGSLLANRLVRYSFTGKASHAAAAPDMGRSALDALELMNIGIQFLREHIMPTARIHYAITDTGGNAPNVVQASASGLYQVRAPQSKDVADIAARLDDIARGAALMTGTQVKADFLKGTSNTVLIPALDEVMYRNLREVPNTVLDASDIDFAWEIVKSQLPEDKIPHVPVSVTPMPYNKEANMALPGSSDTGDVSWVCPLSQCGVAAWPAGTVAHTWQVVACGKSDFAHRGMLFAGQVLASTALDVYENPEILAEAKRQFVERTDGGAYECPIPADITPSWLAGEID